jgi:hypothetical protein
MKCGESITGLDKLFQGVILGVFVRRDFPVQCGYLPFLMKDGSVIASHFSRCSESGYVNCSLVGERRRVYLLDVGETAAYLFLRERIGYVAYLVFTRYIGRLGSTGDYGCPGDVNHFSAVVQHQITGIRPPHMAAVAPYHEDNDQRINLAYVYARFYSGIQTRNASRITEENSHRTNTLSDLLQEKRFRLSLHVYGRSWFTFDRKDRGLNLIFELPEGYEPYELCLCGDETNLCQPLLERYLIREVLPLGRRLQVPVSLPKRSALSFLHYGGVWAWEPFCDASSLCWLYSWDELDLRERIGTSLMGLSYCPHLATAAGYSLTKFSFLRDIPEDFDAEDVIEHVFQLKKDTALI